MNCGSSHRFSRGPKLDMGPRDISRTFCFYLIQNTYVFAACVKLEVETETNKYQIVKRVFFYVNMSY